MGVSKGLRLGSRPQRRELKRTHAARHGLHNAQTARYQRKQAAHCSVQACPIPQPTILAAFLGSVAYPLVY